MIYKILQLNLLIFLALCACAPRENQNLTDSKIYETKKGSIIIRDNYQLWKAEKQQALIILFPCFPCNAENTLAEFKIDGVAMTNNITVLSMNFNQHLWLETTEKQKLAELLVEIVKEHNIKTDQTFIGGFSSGGNVSLLLTDYLKASKSIIQPKGVFIADSPIDLLALYENAINTLKQNFSETAVQEANWIKEKFEAEFGFGDTSLVNYEAKSPFYYPTNSINNLSNLNDVKIRLYTEPDTLWWKENRQTEYKGMNAYYIERLANSLAKRYGIESIAYIKTENRGYRASGERHPHSWAIIDEQELVKWILKH
jgi:hypothetical protein